MRKALCSILLMTTALLSLCVSSAPLELADYGIHEKALLDQSHTQNNQVSAPFSATRAQRSIALHQYPVVTKSMRPSGRHSTVHRAHTGSGNVFLIGTDFYSTSWLRKNHAQLIQLGARGIVVNVPNAQSFARLKQFANGLPLVAASVEDLARQLNLTHYPILITESVR